MSAVGFDHLLTQQVTIAPDDGIDPATGAQQSGAQTVYDARIEYGTSRVTTANGEIKDTLDRICIAADVGDSILVWLPDDDTSTLDEARHPESVEYATTPSGDVKMTIIEL